MCLEFGFLSRYRGGGGSNTDIFEIDTGIGTWGGGGSNSDILPSRHPRYRYRRYLPVTTYR
jgi:hypothetical protein